VDELSVAVVGAAGLLGREVLDVLDSRQFPTGHLRLLGTHRTAGGEIQRDGRTDKIALLGPSAFDDVDVAFFSAGPGVSGEYGPLAARAGATVIDLTSRFRLDEVVPLIVPQVNVAALAERRERNIVATPSAVATALAVVLAPLSIAAGLRRVVVSTYQGVAGAGRRALVGLSQETVDLLGSRGTRRTRFARPIAFNCVPQVGAVEPGGATTHELRVVEEVRKVLGEPSLALTVTAVRVPIFFGVGIGVTLETEQPLDVEEAAQVLRTAPGMVVHHGETDAYPTPADAVGTEAVHVGRLRPDVAAEHGLALWIALDGVRTVALDAVAIAEFLAREQL
jgi:aspartate-semialdehyde dehydrogenase